MLVWIWQPQLAGVQDAGGIEGGLNSLEHKVAGAQRAADVGPAREADPVMVRNGGAFLQSDLHGTLPDVPQARFSRRDVGRLAEQNDVK